MAWVALTVSSPPMKSVSGISSRICRNLSCDKLRRDWKRRHIWFSSRDFDWDCVQLRRHFVLTAENNDSNIGGSLNYEKIENEIEVTGDGIKEEKNNSLKELVHIPSPPLTLIRSSLSSKFAIAIYITLTALLLIARKIMLKTRSKNQFNNQGSISDLVRRGQFKSTRRTIQAKSYNDPFDNQFVKSKEDTSTVEMFGKTYKLTPSKLTKEKQLTHQERRSRAYQWKRPEIFLKEGEEVPDNVDPGSVRWIPSNHPFAETCSDLNEEMVKTNLFQRDGLPSQVRAKHEALQNKLDEEAKLESGDESRKMLEKLNEKKDEENPFMRNQKRDNSLMRDQKQDDQNPFMRNHRSV